MVLNTVTEIHINNLYIIIYYYYYSYEPSVWILEKKNKTHRPYTLFLFWRKEIETELTMSSQHIHYDCCGCVSKMEDLFPHENEDLFEQSKVGHCSPFEPMLNWQHLTWAASLNAVSSKKLIPILKPRHIIHTTIILKWHALINWLRPEMIRHDWAEGRCRGRIQCGWLVYAACMYALSQPTSDIYTPIRLNGHK